MAVDRNAVREGTRWDLRVGSLGRIVVVDEVTSRSVIFTEESTFKTEAMKLEGFLSRARDPLKAERARLMDGLLHFSHGEPVDSPTAKLLNSLRDVALYLLERMPPSVPPYVEPVLPAPKAEPAPVVVEPAPVCVVADPEMEPEIEGYAVVMPDVPKDVVERKDRYARLRGKRDGVWTA